MSEQRWGLFYAFYVRTDYRFGWAEQNPSTRAWTTVMDVRYATFYPTKDVARRVLLTMREALSGAPWFVPEDAWTVKRVGDVGEPLTRYHDECEPVGATQKAGAA